MRRTRMKSRVESRSLLPKGSRNRYLFYRWNLKLLARRRYPQYLYFPAYRSASHLQNHHEVLLPYPKKLLPNLLLLFHPLLFHFPRQGRHLLNLVHRHHLSSHLKHLYLTLTKHSSIQLRGPYRSQARLVSLDLVVGVLEGDDEGALGRLKLYLAERVHCIMSISGHLRITSFVR